MNILILVVLMAFGCCLMTFVATGSPAGTLVREGAQLQMRKRALPRRLQDDEVVQQLRLEELVEKHFRYKRASRCCSVHCFWWCFCCLAK